MYIGQTTPLLCQVNTSSSPIGALFLWVKQTCEVGRVPASVLYCTVRREYRTVLNLTESADKKCVSFQGSAACARCSALRAEPHSLTQHHALFMTYESGWSTPSITVAHIDITETDATVSPHITAPASSTRQPPDAIHDRTSKDRASKERRSWQKSMNVKLRRSLGRAAVSLKATVAVRTVGDSPTTSDYASSDVSPKSSEGSPRPCLALDEAERAARRAARLARWTSDKMVVTAEFRNLGEDNQALATGAI